MTNFSLFRSGIKSTIPHGEINLNQFLNLLNRRGYIKINYGLY